jgi:hypothetical protein
MSGCPKSDARARTSRIGSVHTPATAPDPWTALGLDRSTFFDPGAKEALLRGNAGIEGTHGTRR